MKRGDALLSAPLCYIGFFFIFYGAKVSTAYNSIPSITLISDPLVIKIPIKENHESFVDLTKQSALAYGPSPEIPNNTNYTFLRKSVYEKLLLAQQALPKGIRFCIYEGYRSLDLQKMLFEKQYTATKKRHPDWSKNDIFKETTKLVSPVVNPDKTTNIPPHSTGGAIDIYLLDEKGRPLEMGIHPKNWMQDKNGELSLTSSLYISPTARTNRKIMGQVLSKEGFVNYPTEYWHWSYGDKYWAFVAKKPYALYGSTPPPQT